MIDLVVFSVEAFNVVRAEEGEIHFNQLHAECNNRIRYQKVCPVHGPVEKDEIVLGYEYEKNKYAVLDPSDVEKMRTQRRAGAAGGRFRRARADRRELSRRPHLHSRSGRGGG